MHRVVFVVVPPVYSFDLAIAQMVLDAARPGGDAGYETTVCTAQPGRVESLSGSDVVVEHGLTAAEQADTLVVIGGGAREDIDPRVLEVVRTAADSGKRVAAICTGTFIAAQAGILDGRRATTHWGLTDELVRRHPAVTVVPDVLYVADGPVLTCAGAGACVELCLHLVAPTTAPRWRPKPESGPWPPRRAPVTSPRSSRRRFRLSRTPRSPPPVNGH